MFACREHWFLLPVKIRRAIWREYERGQEVSKAPSLRYLAVQRLAVCHTAFKPNDEQAAAVCEAYLREAVVFAEQAKVAGLGDPLEGLVDSQELGRGCE